MINRIEDFATRGERETIDEFGMRAFTFVLRYGIPALLESDALEQADRVGTIAASARVMHDTARTNVTKARTLIALELTKRRAATKAAFAVFASGGSNGGAKVPVAPVSPVIPPSDGEALDVPALDALEAAVAEAVAADPDAEVVDVPVPTLTVSPGAAAVIQTMADRIAASRAERTNPVTGQARRSTVVPTRRAVAPAVSLPSQSVSDDII